MIRGINKRIIEINDIGSDYFERAFLVVRDNNASNRNLEREADRVLQSYFPENYTFTSNAGFLRRKAEKRKKLLWVALGISLAAAAVIAAICIF